MDKIAMVFLPFVCALLYGLGLELIKMVGLTSLIAYLPNDWVVYAFIIVLVFAIECILILYREDGTRKKETSTLLSKFDVLIEKLDLISNSLNGISNKMDILIQRPTRHTYKRKIKKTNNNV